MNGAKQKASGRLQLLQGATTALKQLVLITLSVLTTNSVCASEQDNLGLLTENDLFSDVQPITTATRLSQQRADAPAAISRIDRAMIEASGAQEISDLMRLVPGFQAYHVNGHKFGVATHGMGNPQPGRLEILMDGRSVYLAGFSSADWRALGVGLSDIERIEVVRSPSASSWGANAFQGVVNIITRTALSQPESQISTAAGDQQERRVEASHSTSASDTLVRVAAGFRGSDGYRKDDDGESGYANLRTTLAPTLIDQLDLQLGVSGGYGGIGDSNASQLSRRDFVSHFQSLTWTHDLDNGDQLQLRGYHNYLRYDMEQALISEQFGIPPALLPMLGIPDERIPRNFEEGATRRYDMELQHRVQLAPKWRGLWGLGVRQEEGDAPLLLNSNATLRKQFWRLFGNLEWQPSPRWYWNGGVLAEHNSLVGDHASPRLAVNYRLGAGHTLRGGYSLTYRTPSLLETYQDTRLTHSNGTLILWVKNNDPDMQPEENRTAELGYLIEFPQQRSSLDLRLFREEIDHGIGRTRDDFTEPQALDPLPPAGTVRVRTTNINNSAWVTQGIEAELRIRPAPQSLLAFNYSYLDIEGRMAGGDLDNPADPLLDMSNLAPQHNLSILASHQWDAGYQLSGALYHQSENLWISGSATDAYTRLDLRLAKSLQLGRYPAKFALVAQNIGADYHEFQQRNRFDGRIFVSVELRLP